MVQLTGTQHSSWCLVQHRAMACSLGMPVPCILQRCILLRQAPCVTVAVVSAVCSMVMFAVQAGYVPGV